MVWLRLVISLKSQVFFAKEPYKKDYILQKRPINQRSLLIVGTPYLNTTRTFCSPKMPEFSRDKMPDFLFWRTRRNFCSFSQRKGRIAYGKKKRQHDKGFTCTMRKGGGGREELKARPLLKMQRVGSRGVTVGGAVTTGSG